MDVDNIKIPVKLSVVDEWEIRHGVRRYLVQLLIQYPTGSVATQTVVEKNSDTRTFYEPSHSVQDDTDKGSAEIGIAAPFWYMLDDLFYFQYDKKEVGFDVYISRNKKLDTEYEIAYFLELASSSNAYVISVSNIAQKKEDSNKIKENHLSIPKTSGWWLILAHAIDAYDVIKERVVCD